MNSKNKLMKKRKSQTSLKKINMTRQFIILAVGWSAFTLLIMGLDMRNTWLKSLEAARLQARVALEKDLQYRFWSSQLGGVYGITGKNELQPNPFLSVENRDITTRDGTKLTLINPAYMTRQVHELAGENTRLSGHISSLNPIRPENKPDDWEKEALQQFTNADQEIFNLIENHSTPLNIK